MTDKTHNTLTKSTLTTIGIDKQTNKLVDKLCKRYSLKKGEIVRLAFSYIDKASINPSESPESVKTELAKIKKRMDDIVRFIRHYEEEKLNPMIRISYDTANRFENNTRDLKNLLKEDIETSDNLTKGLMQVLDKNMKTLAEHINKQGTIINNLVKRQTQTERIQIRLLSLYEELSACGITEGKKKEQLRNEIKQLLQNSITDNNTNTTSNTIIGKSNPNK